MIGKYYLVDAGYMLRSGLITPYRGVRYHLKEYSKSGPKTYQELFNLRHASLRNVIERTFGVLKKRFPILSGASEPHYPVEVVTEIVLACCILHNYLIGVDPDDEIIKLVDEELMNSEAQLENVCPREKDSEDARVGAAIRNDIAQKMWQDYIQHRE